MNHKIKVINGNKIFLDAMKKSGIEIPKTKGEALKLLDEIEEDFKKEERKH